MLTNYPIGVHCTTIQHPLSLQVVQQANMKNAIYILIFTVFFTNLLVPLLGLSGNLNMFIML
jgi:hypothetical protein